jgi:TPR repeat protein
LKCFEHAAKSGHATAYYRMGKMFSRGEHSLDHKSDWGKAVECFKLGAAKKCPNSQLQLAICYKEGKGVAAADFKTAINILEKNPCTEEILQHLCVWYDEDGPTRDLLRCFKYLKMMATDYQNSDAQFWIGDSYRLGTGVETNLPEAIKWYHKAAEHKTHPRGEAQWQLAVYYWNEKKDKKKFLDWTNSAATLGFTQAQYELGNLYRLGEHGISQNDQQALKWYGLAATQGNNTEAQFQLGCYWYWGGWSSKDNTIVNQKQAVYWWEMAAKNGLTAAQYNLAACYSDGNGVTADAKMAMYWYGKSAENGDEDAQYELGMGFKYGNGVQLSINQAMYWLDKSVGKRNNDAARQLGCLQSCRKSLFCQ